MSEQDPADDTPPKPKRRFEVTFLAPDGIRRVAGDRVTLAGAQFLAVASSRTTAGDYWQIHDNETDKIYRAQVSA